MTSRPVKPRASRMADIVASVPELTRRTCSTGSTRATISSARRTSFSLGVPPTARKARTGEFTPPGITWLARARSAADAGASEAVWTGTGCELMTPVSQPSPGPRAAGSSAVGAAVGVEVVPHDRHGIADRGELRRGHDVDQVVADALHVDPGDVADGGQAARRQDELDPALVVGALLAGDPATVLQALGGVRQTTA